MRYVRSHAEIGIAFRRTSEYLLDGLVGASHGREPHRTAAGFCRSRSGGVIIALGAAVTAFSTSQTCTALSTFEAELYALVLLVRSIIAFRRIASFILGRTLPKSRVRCDNASVIAVLRKCDLSARTRRIRIHLRWLVEALETEIDIRHVTTLLNAANTLTAAEDRTRFERSVGVLSGSSPFDFESD